MRALRVVLAVTLLVGFVAVWARDGDETKARSVTAARLDPIPMGPLDIDETVRHEGARIEDLRVEAERVAAEAARVVEAARVAAEEEAARQAEAARRATVARPAPTPAPAPVRQAWDGSLHAHPFLVCTRMWESDRSDANHNGLHDGGYEAYNAGGPYLGAYQFLQSTWDSTARASDRPDLIGVDPRYAGDGNQDAMAWALYQMQGNRPWGGRC